MAARAVALLLLHRWQQNKSSALLMKADGVFFTSATSLRNRFSCCCSASDWSANTFRCSLTELAAASIASTAQSFSRMARSSCSQLSICCSATPVETVTITLSCSSFVVRETKVSPASSSSLSPAPESTTARRRPAGSHHEMVLNSYIRATTFQESREHGTKQRALCALIAANHRTLVVHGGSITASHSATKTTKLEDLTR